DHIVSCFWTRWCGSCQKCLRYALAQALSDVDAIDFQLAPLRDDNPALRALLGSLDDRTVPFWEEQTYAIFALYERGALDALPETTARLKPLWPLFDTRRTSLQGWLGAVHPDDLAPSGFGWHLDNPDT